MTSGTVLVFPRLPDPTRHRAVMLLPKAVSQACADTGRQGGQAGRATVRDMMNGRDMDDERRAVAANVLGRVQGVGYRAWVRAQAQRLGLTGWVSNELDGTVRAILMGPEPAVTAMIRMLWQGPAMASVSAVQVEPTCPDHFEEPEGFKIIA